MIDEWSTCNKDKLVWVTIGFIVIKQSEITFMLINLNPRNPVSPSRKGL